MRLKTSLLNSLNNKNGEVKAMALLLFCKNRYTSSTVKDYSYNKLHLCTGLHVNTIKERIKTLKNMHLVEERNNHLTFLSVSSHNNKLNVEIPCEDMEVKEIEMALHAMRFMEIQKNKDFAKQTINLAYNPSKYEKLENVKAARKKCKLYGYNQTYTEYGLAYKTIAKKLGVSMQKAIDVVNYAISKGWVLKEKHQIQQNIAGIGITSKHADDLIEKKFHFITKDNCYRVMANTYIIQDIHNTSNATGIIRF